MHKYELNELMFLNFIFILIGQDFDMSPERFTLENMFAMQLHKYQDIAETIVNFAIKVSKT